MHLQKKKRQHFVSRNYLRKWADGERIFCLMDDRIFKTSLMNVGQEKYFYKLKELSNEEIIFLKEYIKKSERSFLHTLNAGWIHLFDQIFSIRKAINNAGGSDPKIENMIEVTICNFEEELQTKVESDGEKYLNRLYDEDLSFYDSDDDLIPFLYYLCLQYLRTQKMASNVSQSLGSFRDFNIGAMWAVLRHISATNVGWVLYAERRRYYPVLLKNDTRMQFITGDQPVINTFAVGLNIHQEPEDLEFYYPITPQLAFLLTNKEEFRNRRSIYLNEFDVEKYNEGIFEQSGKQVYASDQKILESIRSHRAY